MEGRLDDNANIGPALARRPIDTTAFVTRYLGGLDRQSQPGHRDLADCIRHLLAPVMRDRR